MGKFKPGDRVRVTKDEPYFTTARAGDLGTVVRYEYNEDDLCVLMDEYRGMYRPEYKQARGFDWYFQPKALELVESEKPKPRGTYEQRVKAFEFYNGQMAYYSGLPNDGGPFQKYTPEQILAFLLGEGCS